MITLKIVYNLKCTHDIKKMQPHISYLPYADDSIAIA